MKKHFLKFFFLIIFFNSCIKNSENTKIAPSYQYRCNHLALLKASSYFFLTKQYINTYSHVYNINHYKTIILNTIPHQINNYFQLYKTLDKEKFWILTSNTIFLLFLYLLFKTYKKRLKNRIFNLNRKYKEVSNKLYFLSINQLEQVEIEKNKERIRISEDLHDGVLGELFGIRFGLKSLEFVDENPEFIIFQKYINELQGVEKKIRDVTHKLNNSKIEKVNFSLLLNNLVIEMKKQGNLECKFNIENSINWLIISENTRRNLYYVFQEVFSNIIKHSFATSVSIKIKDDRNSIKVTISDNGKGFDMNSVKNGIGIKNIKLRIKRNNGDVNINSFLNKGTVINIVILKLTPDER